MVSTDTELRPPRILLVEDDDLVREAVGSSLRSAGFDVAALSDGTDLAEHIVSFAPDLAVLDVTLPVGPDGFELASTIRRSSTLPVIFMTASDSVDDRLRGFGVGADDYVVKPFVNRELVARCRAVLRRTSAVESTLTFVADLVVDLSARSVERAGVPIRLTPTEFDILAVLVRRAGQPVTKAELLAEVWGIDGYEPHLVEVQMSGLRRKLEEHGPRIIATARNGAYELRP